MMATNTPPPTSTPITASRHETAPVPRLASTPATIPGSVIAFGMIWSWRSMAVIAMSAARRGAAAAKGGARRDKGGGGRKAAPGPAAPSGEREEIGVAPAPQGPPGSATERHGQVLYHAA